jgi:hypothetical protein
MAAIPAMGVTAEPSICRVRVGTGLGGGSMPSTMFWNCLYVMGALPAFRSMILNINNSQHKCSVLITAIYNYTLAVAEHNVGGTLGQVDTVRMQQPKLYRYVNLNKNSSMKGSGTGYQRFGSGLDHDSNGSVNLDLNPDPDPDRPKLSL